MSIRIKKGNASGGIIRRVEEISGADLGACYQCKKCTSGCPVGDLVESPPSEIMRRLHLGAGKELLESELVWTCASCDTCSARCPMEIDVAAVMDALRALAIVENTTVPPGNVRWFDRVFLKTVYLFGRTYDIAMIGAYKLGTLRFFQDTEKFPAILKKGKIALTPPRGADSKTVKRIFKKALKDKD